MSPPPSISTEPAGAVDEAKAKAGGLLPDLSPKELLRAQAQLFHYVDGFAIGVAIKCAVELGIFDAVADLGGGPVTLQELSAALPVIHPSKVAFLPRVVRLLTQLGFFVASKEGLALTPLSRILVKKSEMCMADYVPFVFNPYTHQPFYRFSDWFRGPAPTGFHVEYGRPLWEIMEEDPELGRMFNEAMKGESSTAMHAIVSDGRDVFEGVGALVDVGGGTGVMATAIAKAFPGIKVTVLDLPQVVAAAVPESSGRVAMIAGDMFQHIPPADAVFLKQILHDWNNDDCVRILKRCREAVAPQGGKVIVFDSVVGSDESDKELLETQLFHNIDMMVSFASCERDWEEWGSIFRRAGFSSFQIKHKLGLRSIIEIYP